MPMIPPPVLAFALAALLPAVASAMESATELTVQAQRECELGRLARERDKRLAHFVRGQALAERAVALDERHADAHFALFCSLGEQVRIDGERITSVFGFRRVMKELDRTLELAPNHLDALSAKGTFLVRLPALFGGNVEKGEDLLRQVIQREPRAVNARLSLAKSYCARGRHDEAMTLALQALELAQAHQRADFLPEARALISQVRAKAGGINSVFNPARIQ
ncbi:MAG: tetratricopeptide repeat protein [Nitrospirota bacterium]